MYEDKFSDTELLLANLVATFFVIAYKFTESVLALIFSFLEWLA